MIKIGVDAMGGDNSPQVVIEGTLLATTTLTAEDKIVLIGNEPIIRNLLNAAQYVGQQIEVVHADEVIEMSDHPTRAFSQKQNSSISIGFKMLKSKQIDVFCSAGNTGAMHVGALFTIKAIEGVQRPAIAGFVPQIGGGYATLLDVGANADCKPEMLEQFAEIGAIVAKYTFGIASPRVALMNIGEEEKKGSLVAQATYQLLKENADKYNFVGNIEGYDFMKNKADVIVTDGFSGNLLLKLCESFYEIAQNQGIDDSFFNLLNYENIGGSPIVGVNGNVVIGHGRSSALAIKNMTLWARRYVDAQVHLRIAEALG